MELHLHDGPLDMKQYDEDDSVVVGEVVHPPGLPRIGSGCYRVTEVNHPSTMKGRPLPPTACATGGN